MILAGDIGGTHTRLALLEGARDGLRPVAEAAYRSRDFPDLQAVLEEFRHDHAGRVEGAGFGVAGPVIDGRCEATNLPWIVDARTVAGQLGLGQVALINDLEAIGYGVAALGEADVRTLSRAQLARPGNQAVIAAGTGLGEAGLFWDGRQHRPFGTEGGHADFAPRTPLETELLHYLLTRHDHVSYERVVSGPGLRNVYEFLRDTGRGAEPPWLAEELAREDPSAAISRAALETGCPLCTQALALFVASYGAEAGNLALKMLAVGGVFLAGGIAPKILPALADGAFMAAFLDKGRLRPVLEAIPVRVILDERVGLLGAGRAASLQLPAVGLQS